MLNTLLEIKEKQIGMNGGIKEEFEQLNENQRKTQEKLTIIQEEERENRGQRENKKIALQERGNKMQMEILETFLEFKFEYLENIEKARGVGKEEQIDIKEEFRAIHSENLMTIKRIMSACHNEVIQPLLTIREGIERNLTKIPSNTRKLLRDVADISAEAKEREEEKEKLDNITKLATLNLLQTSNNVKEMKEVRSNLDEIKLTVKELGLRVIEFGTLLDNLKKKDIKRIRQRLKRERNK
jgi:hypothetical protein